MEYPVGKLLQKMSKLLPSTFMCFFSHLDLGSFTGGYMVLVPEQEKIMPRLTVYHRVPL